MGFSKRFRVFFQKAMNIEETIFQRNIPGKYSTWDEEKDDQRAEEEEGSEGDEDVEQQPDLPEGGEKCVSPPSLAIALRSWAYSVDFLDRLVKSTLPDDVKEAMLMERMAGRQTGVKGMLADHRAIQALEHAERSAQEQQRHAILHRMAAGSVQGAVDLDDEEEDDAFMEAFRAKRMRGEPLPPCLFCIRHICTCCLHRASWQGVQRICCHLLGFLCLSPFIGGAARGNLRSHSISVPLHLLHVCLSGQQTPVPTRPLITVSVELVATSQLPLFGTVRELLSSSFVEEVEGADPRTVVIVHLYEHGVPACVRMARHLEQLAVQRKQICFFRMNVSPILPFTCCCYWVACALMVVAHVVRC